MRTIDSTLLLQLVTHYPGRRGQRQQNNIVAVGRYMPQTLCRFLINSSLRQAHFLAQVCEESYGLSDVEEEDTGAAYEGRVDSLGNTQKGDGVRFKGRGLIQITGRANYLRVGQELNLDLIDDPKAAETPEVAVEIACQFWSDHDLNSLADKDDIRTITQRVNGHRMKGLNERLHYLARAKALLGVKSISAP